MVVGREQYKKPMLNWDGCDDDGEKVWIVAVGRNKTATSKNIAQMLF